MSGERLPGPMCQVQRPVQVMDGTMCLAASARPAQSGRNPQVRQVLLEDRERAYSRMITTDSEEFLKDYVDLNIASVDYWSTPFAKQDMRYREFVVHYRDGRTLNFSVDELPVRRQLIQHSGSVTVRNAARPWRYIKRSGFIFPDFYGEGSTPRLIDIATTIAFNHSQREKYLDVAELSFHFAVILSAYATPPEGPEQAVVRRSGVKLRVPGIRPSRPQITWQDLAEWEQLELAGEGGRIPRAVREGGHTLEKHVYITDAGLQARAPTVTEQVATKFNNPELAVEAINHAVAKNKNILSKFLSGLKPGEAEYIQLVTTVDKDIGYGYQAVKTGAGSVAPSVRHLDNLRTVIVHVQADGTGGFLVRTAYPVPSESASALLQWPAH